MAIPDYQTVMLPLLRLLADQGEHSVSECVEAISTEFKLSEAERQALLPSGTSTVIRNRVGWARTYMKKARLLDSPRRGFIRITGRGRDVLQEKPPRIDVTFLGKFPEFNEFRSLRRDRPIQNESAASENTSTPEESLEGAHHTLQLALEADLLDRLKGASPEFFERIVIELLVRMGYGGSLQDAGQAVGRSGDGGIDGIIKEDRLGLDTLYVQAKRWEGTVERPEIQKFAGALQGHRARKGVFIPTSSFTKGAIEFARMVDSKIVVISGSELARLMIDHNVGVSSIRSYDLKKVDTDYFLED